MLQPNDIRKLITIMNSTSQNMKPTVCESEL